METPKRTLKLIGKVVADRMEKTVVVAVESTHQHPRLLKVVRTTKKYKVHDPREEANVGDVVEIYEGRPVSKTKYMYLGRVIRANEASVPVQG